MSPARLPGLRVRESKPDRRALVVCEDRVARERLVALLGAESYQTRCVERGLDLLGLLGPRSARPQLLVLDISSNPSVGVALLRAVMCEDWSVPVILISDGDPAVERQVRRMGVDTILDRRFDAPCLRRALAALPDRVWRKTPAA